MHMLVGAQANAHDVSVVHHTFNSGALHYILPEFCVFFFSLMSRTLCALYPIFIFFLSALLFSVLLSHFRAMVVA